MGFTRVAANIPASLETSVLSFHGNPTTARTAMELGGELTKDESLVKSPLCCTNERPFNTFEV